MASYYLKGVSGNDTTGNGTSSAPYKTVSKLRSVVTLGSGDIVYVAEAFGPSDFTNMTGVTVCQWAGQTQNLFGGNVSLGTTGWTDTGGGIYSKTLATGLTIASAIAYRATRKDTNGWYGYYKAVAAAATAFSYNYTSGTGVFLLNTSTDGNPAGVEDGTFEYLLGGVNGLTATGCTSCTFDGLWCAFCAGSAAYGFIGGGTNNTCTNCIFSGGYHAGGYVDITNAGNTFVNCDFCENSVASTQGVHYTSGGNVTGGQYIGCRFFSSSFRYPDGTCISPTTNIDAVYAHTDGTGGHVVDTGGVILRNCSFVRLENPGTEVSVGERTDPPSLSTDETQYPMQVYDCTFSNACYTGFAGMAYVRCSLVSPTAMVDGSPIRCGNLSASGVIQSLWKSCFWASNHYDDAATRAFFAMRNGGSGSDESKIILINNTFVEISSVATYWPWFLRWEGGADAGNVYARGNIFAFKMNGDTKGMSFSQNDAAISDSRFDFAGNWYYGEEAAYAQCMSNGANRKTVANWRANIDTSVEGSVVQTLPGFQSVTTSPNPSVGSNLVTTRFTNSVHVDRGINLRKYGGNYGAFQMGASGGSIVAELLLLELL